jgi:hypothetical protein
MPDRTISILPLEQWTGCLRTTRVASAPRAPAPTTELPSPVGWFGDLVPTISQHGPSCCGQAWANWMECMVRRYVDRDALKQDEQIDGYAIWEHGRKKYWAGDMSGGLYLWQGYQAAVDMGVLPPFSALAHIPDDPFAVRRALDISPLVQGHVVGQGWTNPNPRNGCIDHAVYPKPGDQGHATLRLGLLVQDDKVYYPLLNSWGRSWGWEGLGIMSASYSEQTRIDDDVYTAFLPSGWTDWRGWRDYVTRDAR